MNRHEQEEIALLINNLVLIFPEDRIYIAYSFADLLALESKEFDKIKFLEKCLKQEG